MAKTLPWFRMYAEAVDDDKLALLAFEDRWHFVAILCCKCQGILDRRKGDLLQRSVAAKLGLSVRELDEVARRLSEVDLIDRDTFQPKRWHTRQYKISDRSKPGVDNLGEYKGYVYFIGAKTGPVKIGYSKNPWARVKEFQTGSVEKLEVLATIKTHEVSEFSVHEFFEPDRLRGEWFNRSTLIKEVISRVKSKDIKTQSDLDREVKLLRKNYVVTTTDTDTDTEVDTEEEVDKEKEKKPAKKRKSSQKKPIPENFTVSDNVKRWAEEKKFDRLGEHLEAFICKAQANGYKYVDWDAAFRNAIRDDWAGIRKAQKRQSSEADYFMRGAV